MIFIIFLEHAFENQRCDIRTSHIFENLVKFFANEMTVFINVVVFERLNKFSAFLGGENLFVLERNSVIVQNDFSCFYHMV